MNKKIWYILIATLIGCLIVDQLSKGLVMTFLKTGETNLWPFNIKISLLSISGAFNMAQYLQLISAFGFSVFFLFLFFVLNWLWTEKQIGIRMGSAFFTAGIMGDGADILIHNNIVNWINIFNRSFNLTDLYVLTGIFLILFFYIKNRKTFFTPEGKRLRKKLIIEKTQYNFCFYFLFPYLIFTIAFFTFFFAFLKIIFHKFIQIEMGMQSELIMVFSILFIMLSLCFFLTFFAFTLYLSNKLYGPVYAFKKYIREVLKKGSAERPFSIRKGDYFTDLPELAEELKSQLSKKGKS